MGQAREVMDRYTEAVTKSDLTTVADCFAEDAVAYTPDHGEIHGRENIVAYFREMTDALPAAEFDPLFKYEIDDTAIDEGFFSGKNTGPLTLPTGETLPATQREVRLRGCDLATVRDGRIVSYRLYFDQMEFLEQVGLLPEEA
ncbi:MULTISPECIES: nuclear transport factor 2 family protein [unclassified Kitasatospora]|uniref:nuclear transport factor 2 family protein n=1 Tax=unclassified Kitasatospora TaxID=2633591 RepID=UPI000708CEF6|nr:MULTISPECIES: nuclear transport factor 2 family protein [unclassified Kitasatospora]KQV11826.1 polyketide cyclase [Kitasatospora sp. Root107]KRB76797.1 polyketide cyclase [Kitasatospora sp. Root187]